MIWGDLKPAFHDLIKIMVQNLKEYSFKKKGRKLYRLSNNLLEVIDFDYQKPEIKDTSGKETYQLTYEEAN